MNGAVPVSGGTDQHGEHGRGQHDPTDTTTRNADGQHGSHPPTIDCNADTRIGASTASAYPIAADFRQFFAFSTDPGSPPNHAKTTAQATGAPWTPTGLVFTRHDGTPIHPQTATDEFRRISQDAKLPPIRLHDLRHGTATQALAAGIDLKVVSEILGHSSITITADTYSSVLDELKRDAADKIAARLALEDEDDEHGDEVTTDTA